MLKAIQNQIEEIYQIRCPAKVEEYLLDEPCRDRLLSKVPSLAESEETLVVEENREGLDVGLWLRPSLLHWSAGQKWESLDPDHLLHAGPLVEGVSHFVYLLWRAQREETVTHLELELQAEVDKFVLFIQRTDRALTGGLMDSLFSEISWLPSLDPGQRHRYETAIKLASQYCHRLRTRFLNRPTPLKNLYPEIRSFYRMNQGEKIHRILS